MEKLDRFALSCVENIRENRRKGVRADSPQGDQDARVDYYSGLLLDFMHTQGVEPTGGLVRTVATEVIAFADRWCTPADRNPIPGRRAGDFSVYSVLRPPTYEWARDEMVQRRV
jgi:hypothetical protein